MNPDTVRIVGAAALAPLMWALMLGVARLIDRGVRYGWRVLTSRPLRKRTVIEGHLLSGTGRKYLGKL